VHAWGDEIDQRAARALRGESGPLARSELTAARAVIHGSTRAVVSGSDIASMIGIDPEAAFEILDARDFYVCLCIHGPAHWALRAGV
jgi:shikimate kinase